MKTKTSKKAGKKPKITKDMTFEELFHLYPQLAEELVGKGLACMGCPAASIETLEQGALIHRLNPNKLVAELNKKAESLRKTAKRRK